MNVEPTDGLAAESTADALYRRIDDLGSAIVGVLKTIQSISEDIDKSGIDGTGATSAYVYQVEGLINRAHLATVDARKRFVRYTTEGGAR